MTDPKAVADALKPCPFCGSEATYWKGDWAHGDYGVACTNPQCGVARGADAFEYTNEDDDKRAAAKSWNTRALEAIAAPADALTISDYEEVIQDKKRLTRELDVALNGKEGAAVQASLCDLVAQARRFKLEHGYPALVAPTPPAKPLPVEE